MRVINLVKSCTLEVCVVFLLTADATSPAMIKDHASLSHENRERQTHLEIWASVS